MNQLTLTYIIPLPIPDQSGYIIFNMRINNEGAANIVKKYFP
jgi:hypothetical protein